VNKNFKKKQESEEKPEEIGEQASERENRASFRCQRHESACACALRDNLNTTTTTTAKAFRHREKKVRDSI